MHGKKQILPGDRLISISALILVIFGSLMIISAEMGVSVGDASYLTSIVIRQAIYVLAGFAGYFIFSHLRVYHYPIYLFFGVYGILLVALLACRLFGQIGGAYAWIVVGGGATIQPSEFAKVFMIGFAGRFLSIGRGDEDLFAFKVFGGMALVMFLIVAVYQHDFGSAIVLFVICYCVMMIPDHKQLRKIQIWMRIIVIGVIALALLALSDPVTEILKKHADNYMIGRFLAAADPFLYQYDSGYHLIMSLVSFANGGWFGLGYGNSIHKYMNFPNPSNDFILPVIVEELGIVGFAFLMILYAILLFSIMRASFRSPNIASRMVYLGTFVYFSVHFILNVGGVSGLIPLTGVPLLLISSGGSSLMASLVALGLVQGAIRHDEEGLNEDNSGEIQADADQNA